MQVGCVKPRFRRLVARFAFFARMESTRRAVVKKGRADTIKVVNMHVILFRFGVST